MGKFLFLLLGFIFIASCSDKPSDLVIAEEGKSKYRIIYGEKANDSIIKAAEAFQKNLKLTTGFEIPVYSDIVAPQEEEILVGPSNRNQSYLSTIPLKDVADGYYAGVKGKKWIILSNSATGLTNGLTDIIVRYGGIKINENITQFSLQRKMVVPAAPVIFKPSFSYRQAINPNALNPDYRSFNFINVDNQNDWGTWEYSMERIFPSESYFKTHPQYYAFVNGKHTPSQVDFSYSGLQADMEKNLEVWTMAKGRATYWSISPYPNHIVSEDELTMKTIKETGSASGAVLKLVNEVAKKNHGRTYAVWLDGPYRKAPSNIKPEPNVMLVLDTKDVDHSVSLGEGTINESFRTDLKAWKAITENIAVVSHVTNEERFMMPFPNLHSLQKSLQYLNGEGIKKIIFNGVSGLGSSVPELKFYVASNLAWDVNQNVDSLIWKFCDNKYGEGGKSMYGYIQALESTIQSTRGRLSAYGSPSDAFRSWLTPNNINQLYSYFNATTAMAYNNSELKAMMEINRLSLIYTQLEVAKSMGTKTFGYFMNIGALSQLIKQEKSIRNDGAIISDQKPQWGTIQGMRDLVNQFITDCDRYAVRVVDRNGTTPAQFGDEIFKYISQKVLVHGAFKKGTYQFNVSPDHYFGDGDESLLNDGILGIENNPRSTWVGISGGEMEVSWSTGKDTLLKSISTRFLQQPKYRAWMPNQVTCLVSTDGKTFKEINSVSLKSTDGVQNVNFNLGSQVVRAVKLKATGRKTCPMDQAFPGQPAAFIIDELIVQ